MAVQDKPYLDSRWWRGVEDPCQCATCVHCTEYGVCKAYPGGIPAALMQEGGKHEAPYPDDHGYRYEYRLYSSPRWWDNPLPKTHAPVCEGCKHYHIYPNCDAFPNEMKAEDLKWSIPEGPCNPANDVGYEPIDPPAGG